MVPRTHWQGDQRARDVGMAPAYLICVDPGKEQGGDAGLLEVEVERGLGAPEAAHPG